MYHVNLGKHLPKAFQALSTFTDQAEQDALDAGLDKRLIELVKIRASQLNGCAYCLRLHVREAIAAGETSDRLALVAAWWESQYFTPIEQAALTIAEQVTNISGQRTMPSPDAAFDALSEHQAAAISWVAIGINAWNRAALTGHHPVIP
jgi:AhpD family alkylhydroperoxidase